MLALCLLIWYQATARQRLGGAQLIDLFPSCCCSKFKRKLSAATLHCNVYQVACLPCRWVQSSSRTGSDTAVPFSLHTFRWWWLTKTSWGWSNSQAAARGRQSKEHAGEIGFFGPTGQGSFQPTSWSSSTGQSFMIAVGQSSGEREFANLFSIQKGLQYVPYAKWDANDVIYTSFRDVLKMLHTPSW